MTALHTLDTITRADLHIVTGGKQQQGATSLKQCLGQGWDFADRNNLGLEVYPTQPVDRHNYKMTGDFYEYRDGLRMPVGGLSWNSETKKCTIDPP